jgi:hypothetical protein
MPQIATAADYAAPGMGSKGQDSRVYVKFSLEAIQDTEKSNEAGRPIFKDEEFITIMVPGDRDFISRPVRNVDKQEFSVQYNAFKAGMEQPTEGTPLASLPFLTKVQVAELNAVNVKTAEQLRDMSDVLSQQFMGINLLKKQVGDFLAAAAGAAPALKLQAELEKRDTTIATLQKALDDQGKKIEELTKRK